MVLCKKHHELQQSPGPIRHSEQLWVCSRTPVAPSLPLPISVFTMGREKGSGVGLIWGLLSWCWRGGWVDWSPPTAPQGGLLVLYKAKTWKFISCVTYPPLFAFCSLVCLSPREKWKLWYHRKTGRDFKGNLEPVPCPDARLPIPQPFQAGVYHCRLYINLMGLTLHGLISFTPPLMLSYWLQDLSVHIHYFHLLGTSKLQWYK